jgi:hypothetical protein
MGMEDGMLLGLVWGCGVMDGINHYVGYGGLLGVALGWN